MIIISILIIFVHSLDNIALQVTYAFLMGSSEGKAIIFFFLMGSLLILSQFVKDSTRIANSKYTSKPGNYYLKLIIILVFCTFILGQIFEIWIRVRLGVPIFTTFVSTSPSLSTSSIIHSHVFKSMLGLLISDIGVSCTFKYTYRTFYISVYTKICDDNFCGSANCLYFRTFIFG